MARIRTIKPEMWQDEKLAPLPAITRLVFIGLISMADDAGRVLDSTRAVDGFIFPETEDTSREAIDMLVELGLLDRGVTASGQRVLQISKWSHQKIDKPNLSAALPPIAILGESSRRRRCIPAKVRLAIIERDGGVCQKCGVVVRPDKCDRYDSGPDLAEIDHVIPVKDGGTNEPQNLQLLCLSCNRKKAGEEVRRRNGDASGGGRGNVGDASAPHINDLRSPIPDPLPPTSDHTSASADVRAQVDQDFDEVWAKYPKREGGNPRHDALKAYRARRRTGVEHQTILDGVIRYAAYCHQREIVGTGYVKQAATFLGPGQHYLEAWTVELRPRRTNNPADRVSATIAQMTGRAGT